MKNISLKSFLIVLCAVTAVTVLNGCGNPDENRALRQVTLASARNVWTSLTHIAVSEGFFEEEGLDVQVQFLQGGRFCLDALVAGSAEFANIVEVNVAYFGFTENQNLKVLANMVNSDSSAVIARGGVGINEPSDLRGKTLAISPGMTSEVFAHRLLEKHQVSVDEINFLNVQPNAMFATMIGNGADAASSWEPFIHNIKNGLQNNYVSFEDPQIYTGYELIATRSDWALENEETVAAFLRAQKKASDFAQKNPEMSIAIVAEAIELDIEIVRAIWPNFDMTLELDEAHMTSEVEEIGRWISNTQRDFQNSNLPNYGSYFDNKYLNSILAPN